MKFFTSILVFIIFCGVNATAQEIRLNKIQKRIYTTKKLVKTPIIDGGISEEAWDIVEWSSDFIEKTPDEGTEPTHQTQFKVMHDAK